MLLALLAPNAGSQLEAGHHLLSGAIRILCALARSTLDRPLSSGRGSDPTVPRMQESRGQGVVELINVPALYDQAMKTVEGAPGALLADALQANMQQVGSAAHAWPLARPRLGRPCRPAPISS